MRLTIEQELSQRGHSFFQTVGDSMEPLLHNRKSTVVVAEKKVPLKQYDVVLYHRPTGEYVLHRVIKVLDGSYIIRGDNRINREIVPEDWIIGIMIGFYKDECNHFISCEGKIYQNYLRFLKVRYCILWLRALFHRLPNKIFQHRKLKL